MPISNITTTTKSTRRRRALTMKPLVLVVGAAACMVTTASAFTVMAPPAAKTRLGKRPTTATVGVAQHQQPARHTTALSFSMTPLDEVLSDSSLIEEEICNGMSHALLDFTSLWGGGAATRVRLATVLGRLFVIGQDFRQHEVLPDELAFQLGLLAVACHGLFSTLVPKLKAKFLTPTFMTCKDRQAYRSIFRPSGLSWMDFKQLHSECMDWIHVEPGHVLLTEQDDNLKKCTTTTNKEDGEEDAAVYWLYRGDVQVWSHDNLSHNIIGRQEVAGLGLFGEGRLAKLLDRAAPSSSSSKNEKTANSKKTKKKTTTTGMKTVAGESGATLLRIDTAKLEKLLRHDQELTHAINRLAFMGMQDKLDALLVKEASP